LPSSVNWPFATAKVCDALCAPPRIASPSTHAAIQLLNLNVGLSLPETLSDAEQRPREHYCMAQI